MVSGNVVVSPGDGVLMMSIGVVSLPAISNDEDEIFITSAKVGDIIVQAQFGETVDGQMSVSVPAGESVLLKKTGNNWDVINMGGEHRFMKYPQAI